MTRWHHAVALALFALASAVTWWDVFTTGPGPASRAALHEFTEGKRSIPFDVVFEAWLVSRHAHTLMREPWNLLDTEHCAPTEKSLTLGIPMVTLGIVAIPGAIVSDEPVLVYNLSLVLLGLISAFAMYWLVAHWSGVAAAGWIAGLLFGFMPLRLGHIGHPSVWDVSWTVFALFFAERFFARGRWRDALGLGLATALQMMASFYMLLAAACVALPFTGWLLWRDRLRALRPGPAALALALPLLALWSVLVPYLSTQTAGGEMVRTRFQYLEAGAPLLPSRLEFLGFVVIALGAVGLVAPSRRASPGIAGDPRWALLLGGALAWLVASGPGHVWLAGVVPGLDAVRGIARLGVGLHLVWILLAGLGAAVLVRAAGRRGAWVAAALLAAAALDVLRLPAAGLETRYRWSLHDIRPDDASIAFFAELERRGNQGPLLELPIAPGRALMTSTGRILLSGYHGRRTSACFGSYAPPGRELLKNLSYRLPDEEAVEALVAQGFTTVVLDVRKNHLPSMRFLARLTRAAQQPDGALELVHQDEQRAAFRLGRESRSDARPR